MFSRQSLALFLLMVFVSSTSFAGAPPNKAGFDCSKAATTIEKTICASKALSDLDHELASIYQEMISNAFELPKKQLKKEQLQWLAKRDASCGSAEIQDACLQDFYAQRIRKLRKDKSFMSPRVVSFKKSNEPYAQKGDTDINIQRDIWFDLSVDRETGILKGTWKNEKEFSANVMDDASEIEILVAKPFFDGQLGKVKGYYFVMQLSALSRPGSEGRGQCGAGYEYDLVVLRTDTNGKVISSNRHLVDSCLKPIIGNVVIRESARHVIYVIYDVQEKFKMLKIDTMHPEGPITEIHGTGDLKN